MAHVHAKPSWKYWVDFIVYPLVMLAAIVFDIRAIAPIVTASIAVFHIVAFVLGFVFWTLLEYWAHRSVLHTIFWKDHGTHLHHHAHPEDFVIFPLWHLPLFFLGAFVVMPLPFFAGFAGGYVWFLTLHHLMHHRPTWLSPEYPAGYFGFVTRPIARFVQNYDDWHDVHHKKTFVNFGITTQFWDKIFGTFKSA